MRGFGAWWQLSLVGALALAAFATDGAGVSLIAGFAAVGAVMAVVAACASITVTAHQRPIAVSTLVHDRSARAALVVQCDPDATGRPRPRAPGWAPCA